VAKAVEALAGPLPPPDRYEPNDGGGAQAWTVWGKHDRLAATVDYWDDPVDVYRIPLQAGELLNVHLTSPPGLQLELWQPTTVHVDLPASKNLLIATSMSNRIRFRTPRTGFYYVEVKAASPSFSAYTLTLAKTEPTAGSPAAPQH
jgi:hypothetical protein